MAESSETRQYFTVVDDAGGPASAMEYWAATADENQPIYEVVPLRRFVKLIASGELLTEEAEGIFVGERSERMFYRINQ